MKHKCLCMRTSRELIDFFLLLNRKKEQKNSFSAKEDEKQKEQTFVSCLAGLLLLGLYNFLGKERIV